MSYQWQKQWDGQSIEIDGFQMIFRTLFNRYCFQIYNQSDQLGQNWLITLVFIVFDFIEPCCLLTNQFSLDFVKGIVVSRTNIQIVDASFFFFAVIKRKVNIYFCMKSANISLNFNQLLNLMNTRKITA